MTQSIAPVRLSQATTIEQSRAVAEVQAAVVLAQHNPRDEDRAMRRLLRSCQEKHLAERAFFAYERGGERVTGESIHLAREMARCWGNVRHGATELSREGDRSEMMAFAWDMETNVIVTQSFILPHYREKRGKAPQLLTGLRDIYESNANQAARRVRSALFAIMPPWYVQAGSGAARETLERIASGATDGVPFAQRVENMLTRFRAELGIDEPAITRHLEKDRSRWDAQDVAHLGIVFRSIANHEITKEEAFPSAGTVTTDEILSISEARVTEPSEPEDEDWPPTARPPDASLDTPEATP